MLFSSLFFLFFIYSDENSDVLHLDYKQYRQSMVNLDSGNNIYVDKNLLQVTTTNSCELLSAVPTTSVLGQYNKKNLSESCVINATCGPRATCNACNALKIRSSCNINWATGGQSASGGVGGDSDSSSNRLYTNSKNSPNVNSSSNPSPSSFSPQQQHPHPLPHASELNNVGNLSITNLRTNSYKSADNSYCLYKYNEFNECNHLMHNKLNGKNPTVQKNTFFKSFARSSSFLNGCKIKVNSKKLKNISFKFKKSDKVHQQQSENLCPAEYSGGSNKKPLPHASPQFIQNNYTAGGVPTPELNKQRTVPQTSVSIKNVCKNPSSVNSDLKNKYNARSNESNNCQPNQLQLTAESSRSSVVKDHNSNVNKRSSSHCSDPINSYGRERDPNTPPLEGKSFKHFGSVRKHAQCHSYSNSLNRHNTRQLSRNKSNGR